MPLFEKEATVETASCSTAPVFEVASHKDGAPKSYDAGWWAWMIHNADRKPGAVGSWALSAVWATWFTALCSTVMIPAATHFAAFNGAIVLLVLISIWIPDHGDTVFPFYSIVILPIVVFKSIHMGGFWTFSIIGYVFGIIPFFDWLVGVDVGNQTKDVQRDLHGAFRFEMLTLLVAPGVLASLGYGAWLSVFGGLSWIELAGLTIGVGIITGVIGIVAGHELCHKASALERGLGRLLMCCGTYGHFYVEHTLGHHKHVATDLDPATSRYGESFYEFLPRVVIGEFVSACHLENARLKRKGLPWYHSEIPLYFLVSAGIAFALMCLTGPFAVLFFVGQSVVAVLLFESVNYLEHYGLERREIRPGQYEQVQPQHSWDSAMRITNHVMFKLERHADHHAHAGKRYQTLQVYDSSPQLPAGYATMILFAFLPPLWRAVMHPRLMEHRSKQVGQVFRHGPTPAACERVAERTKSSEIVKQADVQPGATAIMRKRGA